MDTFFGWVRGIACYLLLVSLLMLLLPSEQYKKYMKLATGLVLILLVIGPALRLLGLEDKVSEYYNSFQQLISAEGAEIPEAELEQEAAEAAVRAYESWIRQKSSELAEATGYQVTRMETELSEEKETLGELKRLYLRVRTAPKDERLVEPVIISSGTGGKASAESLGVRSLKRRLAEAFSLEEQAVLIEEGK